MLSCMVATVAIASCGWSTQNPSSPASLTYVGGGQAFLGSITSAPDEIAAIATPATQSNSVIPGIANKQVQGVVGPDASAVAIGVPGDEAYWLVPAPTQDPGNSDLQRFSAKVSFSPQLGKSPLIQYNTDGTTTLPLYFRAVDDSGRFGQATILALDVGLSQPSGSLFIALDWDSPTDLDLHVLAPADTDSGYSEIWAGAPSLSKTDGILTSDSNRGCQIDNRDYESIAWKGTPPAGHYIARASAFSLCGQTSAAWHAAAYLPTVADSPIREATGILNQASVRTVVGEGAGITVFEFDYP
jgi:hypothetical protein